MKAMSKIMLAAAMAAVSVSANAWWGGPSSWGDDFFGNGGFDFNMSASASGNGWNRYSRHYGPYYGYAPYGNAPYAAIPEMNSEQQIAFAEQQAKAHEQAMAAQRQYADQMAQYRPQFPTMGQMPEMPSRDFPVSFEDREQMRDQMVQQMQDRRDEMLKQVEDQRQAAKEQHAAMRGFRDDRRFRRDI